MNYINAITPFSLTIEINHKPYIAYRRGLKDHYRLLAISHKLQSDDPLMRVKAMSEYVSVAFPDIDVNSLDLTEYVRLYSIAVELNDKIDLLPWQTTYNADKDKTTTSADYKDRELALITHYIANAYGWSEEVIHNLQPEAAACYMQEILLDDWKHEEFLWCLSEVGYDKNGKLRPYPKPSWYTEIVGPSEKEARTMIHRNFIPDGIVIDPEKERLERSESKKIHNDQ